MEMLFHSLNWFEIPVKDFDRAKQFYSQIYDFDMPEINLGPNRMGFLLHDQEKGGIGGAIVAGEGYEPSDKGVLVYLNGGEDIDTILNRVEEAGGRIVTGKNEISPDLGYFAIFVDSEGNRIALHSNS